MHPIHLPHYILILDQDLWCFSFHEVLWNVQRSYHLSVEIEFKIIDDYESVKKISENIYTLPNNENLNAVSLIRRISR